MKVIVTGATSFIGSAVVEQLMAQGHQVCAVVRPGSKNMGQLEKLAAQRAAAGRLQEACSGRQRDAAAGQLQEACAEGLLGTYEGQLQVIELDLHEIEKLPHLSGPGVRQMETDARDHFGNRQTEAEAGDCSGAAGMAGAGDVASDTGAAPIRADAWIHAGWDGAGSDNRRKRDMQQANVMQSLAAVRAAAACGCRRFLFTGSQAEYGIYHQTVSEDMACHPVSEYGKAKTDFANQAKPLCKMLKMEYIHTRIFSVYGPGDHPWSLVQTCLETWRRGGQMSLGPCTQQWNFLYIADVAAALCHLLTEGAPGTYNIAGRDTRPLRDYIEEMYALCGGRGSFSYGRRPQNAEGAADLMPDISRILRETSWEPKVSFADGIRKMWEE